MEKFNDIKERVNNGWQNLDSKKRWIMVGVIAAIIVIAMVYSFGVKSTSYSPLFSNLDMEDAGKIVEDLDNKKIKYKLEDKGSKILIDSKKIDKYRLELAMDGNMPSKSSGFELFDDIGLMVTDDDRKIMYQRALEGELERSISYLENVRSAKVHLVMSEKSIFETEEKDASASIILDLEDKKGLSDNAIYGIASLVSGAVENLPDKNIKIVDSKGNLLSRILNDDTGYNSTDIMSRHQVAKEELETKMKNNLLGLLEDVFGKGKVKVAVNVDLDFDAEEETSVKYSDPVVRSQKLSASGKDIETQEVNGQIGYNPSNVIKEVSGDNASFESTINNEVSSTTNTKIKSPGRIKRVSTSVIYDGRLSNNMQTQMESIVKSATGYDFERNDLVSVVGLDFNREEKKVKKDTNKEASKMTKEDLIKNYGVYGLAGILALVIILIIILRSRSKAKAKEEQLIEESEFGEDFLGDMNKYMGEDSKEDVESIQVKIDTSERKAKEYAEEHPDLAADLIKAWLKD